MTESAKAVDTVFRRHGWKSTETMPIETHMAQAWFAELEDMPDHDYAFATVQTEVHITPREMLNAAIWVCSAGGLCGFALIGACTFGRWVYGWMQ